MSAEDIRPVQDPLARANALLRQPIAMAQMFIEDHLHHLRAEWRHLPAQAVDVTLHQVQEPDDNMSFHLLQQLTEEVHGDRYCSAYYCYWGLSGTPLDIMHL